MKKEMNPTLTLKEKTIRGVIWLGSSQIIFQVLAWTCTIFVVRILSPSDYGIMSMAMIVIGFVQLFSGLGIDQAIIQKKDITKPELDSLFWINLASGTFFFLTIFLSTPFFSWFFDAERLTPVLRVLGANFIICSLYSIPYALLTKELAFSKRSRAEIGANVFSSLLTLMSAYLGFSVWSLVIGYTSRNIALLLALSFTVKYCPGTVYSFATIGGLVTFGIYAAGSRIFWYIYSNADYLIVGKFLGQTVLGYYTMAFELSSMPIDKVSSLVNPVATASFSRLQDKVDELKNYFLTFTRATSTLIFPALTGLMFISSDFVNLVLTPKWAPAILPLQTLALMGIFKCLSIVVSPLLHARGKPNISMYYTMSCAVIMSAAFLVGVRYGLEGVSLAWLTVFPWLASFMVYLGCREVGASFKEFVLNLSPSLMSTLAMLAALAIAKALLSHYSAHMWILGLYILSGALAYIGVLVIFSPRFRADIAQVVSR